MVSYRPTTTQQDDSNPTVDDSNPIADDGSPTAMTETQPKDLGNPIAAFQATFERIRREIATVIVGHDDVVNQILIALFAGGHVLLEGVPGTGKTLMVHTLAQALNLQFARVQFTVDVLPADVTGTRILVEQDGKRDLVFAPGPVFTNVLLADEINRATPKTQSALLEAMAEGQVTSGGSTYQLAPPFFVLATLNPIEMEGTYPLPEAQLDRFLFKVYLPYPNADEMQRILGSTTQAKLLKAEPILQEDSAAHQIEEMKHLVREVLVAPHLEQYAATLVRATIPDDCRFAPSGTTALPTTELVNRYVGFGSSPRGGQALLLGAKVRALLAGRANITHEDIDSVAIPSLNHRLVLNFAAQADAIDPRVLIEGILDAARHLHR